MASIQATPPPASSGWLGGAEESAAAATRCSVVPVDVVVAVFLEYGAAAAEFEDGGGSMSVAGDCFPAGAAADCFVVL